MPAGDDAGTVARADRPGDLLLPVRGAGGVRVEATVRGAGAGLAVDTASGTRVRATTGDDRLRVQVLDRRGRVISTRTAVAPGTDVADRHWLVLTVRDGTAVAELSDARLGDPSAVVRVALPRSASQPVRAAGATALRARAEIDDLSAVRAADPVRVPAPPRPGRLDAARSVEFDGPLDARWTRVRDPQASVRDGALHWPVEEADLAGPGGTASLLLQDPPAGDWTVQTSVDVSALGTDEVRNYQQAGIVARVDDDRWVRLSAVAIWNTRQVELGVEQPYAGRVVSAGSIVGPPGARTWLRLQRGTNRAGEVTLTGWSSQDGRHWVRGGTWTLPPGARLQVGLGAHGGQPGAPPAEVSFDHLRWYRDSTGTTCTTCTTSTTCTTRPGTCPASSTRRWTLMAVPTPGPALSRRSLLTLGGGLAGLAALSGCASGGPVADAGPPLGAAGYNGPPVTLEYWNGFTGGDGPAMRGWSTQFNASQDLITVRMNTVQWAQYYQRVIAAVHAGQGPGRRRDARSTSSPRRPRGRRINPIDDVVDELGAGGRATTRRRCGRTAPTTAGGTACRSTCTRSPRTANLALLDRRRSERQADRRRRVPRQLPAGGGGRRRRSSRSGCPTGGRPT